MHLFYDFPALEAARKPLDIVHLPQTITVTAPHSGLRGSTTQIFNESKPKTV